MAGACGLLVAASLNGCAARRAPVHAWDTPRAALLETWAQRFDSTATAALLARVDFAAPDGTRSFTLEIFYRAPELYLLRGRGTLGVTGFRARLSTDSLVVLLDRERRGFAGTPDAFPDTSARAMWALLRELLPWLFGGPDLEGCAGCRLRTAERGTRPAVLQVRQGDQLVELDYGRYRSTYPFWHLRSVFGRSPAGSLALDVRQQLYNIALDSSLFDLRLPAGTRPLVD